MIVGDSDQLPVISSGDDGPKAFRPKLLTIGLVVEFLRNNGCCGRNIHGALVAMGPIASSSIAVIIPPWIVPMEFMKSGTAANSTLIAPLAGSRVRSFQPSSVEAGGRGLRPWIMSQNGPLRTLFSMVIIPPSEDYFFPRIGIESRRLIAPHLVSSQ
jgi:hypothetical protein